MNAIYLHPVDGFTFLENVPEKIDHPCEQMPNHDCPMCSGYERALAEAIEKRMVIDNWGEFFQITHNGVLRIGEHPSTEFKEGDLYLWPGTHHKQWQVKSSTGKNFSWLNCNEAVAKDRPGFSPREVVILSSPKGEKSLLEKEEDVKIADYEHHYELHTPERKKPVNSSMSEKEAIPEWKDLLRQAADKFVTTHEDSEVRRMYGHHFRSFRDGAIWEHERVKGEPVVSQDQDKVWEELMDEINSNPEERVTFTTIAELSLKFKISRKPID